MPQLQDKKIIVTGGASGIGAATVRAYIAEGASVALLDVNEDSANDVIRSLGDSQRCRFYHCDIADSQRVDAVFDEATAWLGGLDVLVNLGAIINYKNAEDFNDQDMARIFDVNIKGTMVTNQAAFRSMQQTGGHIINTGSMSGIRPHPGNAAYSATKGAVMAWTRSVAGEWGKYNIRLNALAPVAQTPMADVTPANMTAEQHEQSKQMMAQQLIPLGRVGDVEADIAPVLVFLASDASHYMTGQVISVDGGTTMLGS